MNMSDLQFAYWVPNVSGGLVVSKVAQRTDHSPAYNIDTAKAAERYGFDYALTQVRYLASYGADAQHESTSFSQLLLANTERLKVIAAVHPGFWQPAVLAKLAATAQEWSNGRFARNVVSGWFKKEFRDLTFRPQLTPAPEIFQGGNSTSARHMAGRLSDVYFMNGNTVQNVAEQTNEVGGYAADHGRRPRFGLNGFAVVRDTEQEARRVVQEIIDNTDEQKVRDFGDAVKQAGSASSDGKGMWAGSQFKDLVQYNDGF